MTKEEAITKLKEQIDRNVPLYNVWDVGVVEFLKQKYPDISLDSEAKTNKYRAGVFLLEVGGFGEPACSECGGALRETPNVKTSGLARTTEDRIGHYWNWPIFCGGSCATRSDITKKARENTFLEKYGVKNPMMNPSVSQKVRKPRSKDNYSASGIEQRRNALLSRGAPKELVDAMYLEVGDLDKCRLDAETIKRYVTEIEDAIGKPIYRKEICEILNIHKVTLNRILKRSPDHAHLYRTPQGLSSGMTEILDHMKSIVPSDSIIINDRGTIPPLEIDILIKNKNIGIEYNGVWCHSEFFAGKTKSYHLNKTKLAEDAGIRLFHIYDTEWDDPVKREIWKSILRVSIGMAEERYFARKCVVRNISSAECRSFMEKNHLAGFVGGAEHIALTDADGSILIAGTFGKSRFGEGVEVLRIATKLNCVVVGGVSKIITEFLRQSPDAHLTSYANRRHSSALNCVYGKMMVRVEDTQPNYIWFNKNYKLFYSRYQTQKHKLKSLLGEGYNEEETEAENMVRCGFDRIWDCGNLKFVLTNHVNIDKMAK